MSDSTSERDAAMARAELQKAQTVMEQSPQDALGHLVEARRLDPRNTVIAGGLARLEVRLGRFADALESLQRVLNLDESDGEALGLSALCEFRLLHFEQAQVHARATLALDHKNAFAREILADCHRVEGNWRGAAEEFRCILESATLNKGPRARVRLKLAQCLLNGGEHAGAWEITHSLIAEGYSGEQVAAIHHACDRLNRQEMGTAFGKRSFFEKLILWAAKKQVSQALFFGRRSAGTAVASHEASGPEETAAGTR